MNTIWIVMPILIALMFLLGIDINKKALPAICYVLLTYVYFIRRKHK